MSAPEGPEAPALTALKRAEASLREAAAVGREVQRVGAFQLALAPAGVHPLLSVAVPLADPEEDAARRPDAWDGAVAALLRAFREAERPPRLEYMHDLHPDLAPALARAERAAAHLGVRGFRFQGEAPVLTLTPGRLQQRPSAAEARAAGYRRLDANALRPMLQAQARAYGPHLGDPDAWLPLLGGAVRSGHARAAALQRSGEVVAGATLQLGGDAAELAGVFTLPAWRGRGLAALLCARLLEEYFADGGSLVWLSAAEGAQGVYRRLGFHEVGAQRNYGA